MGGGLAGVGRVVVHTADQAATPPVQLVGPHSPHLTIVTTHQKIVKTQKSEMIQQSHT